MKNRLLIVLTAILIYSISIPAITAAEDYFYIQSTDSPYMVIPGESLTANFVLVNQELKAPKNVTAYIYPCPLNWYCEEKTFSYEKLGEHTENLTIKVPKTAIQKRYTMYIRLRSDYPTTRGDDRILIDVVKKKVEAISYEEYQKKTKDREEPTGIYIPTSIASGEVVSTEKTSEEKKDIQEEKEQEKLNETDKEKKISADKEKEKENKTKTDSKKEVVENIEKLESDKGFVEYATVVLIILLAVTAIGALYSYKKKR